MFYTREKKLRLKKIQINIYLRFKIILQNSTKGQLIFFTTCLGKCDCKDKYFT